MKFKLLLLFCTDKVDDYLVNAGSYLNKQPNTDYPSSIEFGEAAVNRHAGEVGIRRG